MANVCPTPEFHTTVDDALKRMDSDPSMVDVAIQYWLATGPEMGSVCSRLRDYCDPERVVRVLLELCDLTYANQGMQNWYRDLDRTLFYARLRLRLSEPEPTGTIIHDEGPEPEIEP